MTAATTNIGAVTHVGRKNALKPAALACAGGRVRRYRNEPALLYVQRRRAGITSPSGQVSPEAVLGIVSLIFWSLIIVISIKYAILIMRADNHGEGGILALLALISPRRVLAESRLARRHGRCRPGRGDAALRRRHDYAGNFGAECDRGVKIYAPQMGRIVVPLTVVIPSVGLFLIQRRSFTSFIGGLFGPVMLIWFFVAGGRPRHRRNRPEIPLFSRGSVPCRPSPISGTPDRSRWPWSAAPSSRSPAARRFTPTWDISGPFRSASRGSAWRCRPSPSIISAKAAFSLRNPARSTVRSTSSLRSGRTTHSWCSRRSPP